jgi:hypothetical protein
MKKIILLILTFLGLGLINNVWGGDCVCCEIFDINQSPQKRYEWRQPGDCSKVTRTPSGFPVYRETEVSPENCQNITTQPSTCQIPKPTSGREQLIPGKVEVTWTTYTVSVCPPGILGGAPCNYPSLIDLIKRINQLLLTISPPLLVILLILGGLMYLLTPFGVEEYIKKGHNYIKYAIYGYILLLLVTLIFTIISAVLGGPSPSK